MNFKTPSRVMAGFVTLILLGLFGYVFIVSGMQPNVHFDPAMQQTLLTLTVVAVSYYLGTSNGSANKDETIATQATAVATQAATAAAPSPPTPPDAAPALVAPPPPTVVKIDDSKPVAVREVPPPAPAS